MKTQNYTNTMTKVLVSALAALSLMSAACSKSSSNKTAAQPPVAPAACTIPGCAPGVTGQFLYGGTTSASFLTQAQFQVSGDPSGNGPASVAGSVSFNNYICQVGMPSLSGQFQIQILQQGLLTSDVFTGNVNLVGPQGTIPAAIEIVPTRTAGTGLFSLYACGARIDMNF